MLPLSSSSNRAAKTFDLIHLDLWTSPLLLCQVLSIIWLFLMILLITYGFST
jgi:hypothetical protein